MPGLRRFRRQAAVLVSWGSLHGKLRFGCRQDTAVARRVKVPRAFPRAAALDSPNCRRLLMRRRVLCLAILGLAAVGARAEDPYGIVVLKDVMIPMQIGRAHV